MPQSDEEKILVRAANGDLYLISKDTIPEKVNSKLPDYQPQDPVLVRILNDTESKLADHFVSTNPGVKLGIAVVDFDGQY